MKIRNRPMQLRQDIDRQLPQTLVPRITLSLQMSFQSSFNDAPFAAPDQQPHFLDADLADKTLAVSS
jgi:hypothetical protein